MEKKDISQMDWILIVCHLVGKQGQKKNDQSPLSKHDNKCNLFNQTLVAHQAGEFK